MIKKKKQVSIERMYLNIIRPHMTSPQLTSYTMMKAERISSKIGMPTLATQHWKFQPENQARKNSKKHSNWKGRSKTVTI